MRKSDALYSDDYQLYVVMFSKDAVSLTSVDYIYFLLSGSKCLSFTSIENITRMSLWAVARTAIL